MFFSASLFVRKIPKQFPIFCHLITKFPRTNIEIKARFVAPKGPKTTLFEAKDEFRHMVIPRKEPKPSWSQKINKPSVIKFQPLRIKRNPSQKSRPSKACQEKKSEKVKQTHKVSLLRELNRVLGHCVRPLELVKSGYRIVPDQPVCESFYEPNTLSVLAECTS